MNPPLRLYNKLVASLSRVARFDMVVLVLMLHLSLGFIGLKCGSAVTLTRLMTVTNWRRHGL